MPEDSRDNTSSFQAPSTTQLIGWCSTWFEFFWLAKSRPAFEKALFAFWAWDGEVAQSQFETWTQLKAWVIVVSKVLAFALKVILSFGLGLITAPLALIGLMIGLLFTHTAWFIIIKRQGCRAQFGERNGYLVIGILMFIDPIPGVLLSFGDWSESNWQGFLNLMTLILGVDKSMPLAKILAWCLVVPDLFLALACFRMCATPPAEAAKPGRFASIRQGASAMLTVASASASTSVRELSSAVKGSSTPR